MAITVGAFAQVSGSASSSAVLSNPSGVADGDLLVALLAYWANGSFATWPTGWQLVGRNRTSTTSTHAAADMYLYVWNTGDPTTHTVTFGGGVTYSGGIVRVSGGDQTTPQDCPGQAVFGNLVTSVTVPAVTVVTAGALLISGAGMRYSGGATGEFLTPPAGMTEVWDGGSDAFAYALQASPGSSGTKVWANTAGGSRRMVGILGAIRPGPPPPAGAQTQRWTGAAWQAATVKRWDGTAWVTATVKRWDGSGWV